MAESAKVLETKEKIKDAFLKLYAKKKIEKISIKELMDLAGLNRGTFYVYFLDIYDIKDQVEDEFFNIMKEKAGNVLDAIIEGRDLAPLLPDTNFYLAHKKYFDIMLSENGDSRLTNKMKEMARALLHKRFGEYRFENNKKLDYLFEYMIGAHLTVITCWLKNGMDIPLESITKLLKDVSTIGPATYFKAELE